MLRRDRDDGRTEFTIHVVGRHGGDRAFVGDDPSRAEVHPDDDRFLVERDRGVTHHEV
jgi:hypothetical protein